MYVVIFVLLLTPRISNARKGGIGSGRGSSAAKWKPHSGARPSHGGYHPQQNVHNPQQSGYHSQTHYQRPAVYHQGVGYHQQGSQMKRPGGGTFGKAVLGGALGAAAGLATFELGKAILRSGSEPLRASNGHEYYFDERNHQFRNGYFMCSKSIDDVVKTIQESSTPEPEIHESTNSTSMSPEQFFKTVQFKDGSSPKSLTWNCKIGTEICCGTECCPVQRLFSGDGSFSHHRSSWLILLSGLLLLVRFCY